MHAAIQGAGVEQRIAQLVAAHAAQCSAGTCIERDASGQIALEWIVWPLTVVFVAVLLQRAGLWSRLRRGLSGRLKRQWQVDAAFGAVVGLLLTAAWLPVGLHDAFATDGATPPVLACPTQVVGCTIHKATLGEIVLRLMADLIIRALGLAGLFAVLAAVLIPLHHNRPRTFLSLVAAIFLGWQAMPAQSIWKQTYALPAGPLRDDIVRMAGRAGIPADKVLMGVSRIVGQDGGGGEAVGGNVIGRVVISEKMLNINSVHPKVFRALAGPYSAAEFRFVAAHEMAHFRNRDAFWLLLARLALSLLAIVAAWVAAKIISRGGEKHERAGPLVVFFACGFALQLAIVPAYINLARVFENQADADALDLAQEPDAMVAFFLREARDAPLSRDRWYHRLYNHHPDSLTRIRRAIEWGAQHPSAVWRASGLTGPVRIRRGPYLDPVDDWPAQ